MKGCMGLYGFPNCKVCPVLSHKIPKKKIFFRQNLEYHTANKWVQ